MSQGVPGIPPSPELLNAVARAAADPVACSYGPSDGDPELRVAVAAEMHNVYHDGATGEVDVKAEDVCLTAGCNMAFVAVIMCLAEQGDEIILPVP